MTVTGPLQEISTTFRVVVDGSGRGRTDVMRWVAETALEIARIPSQAADRLAQATWALLSRPGRTREVTLAMRVDTGLVEIRFGHGPGETLLYRAG
ncbi:MAG: hypothetical protein H6742_06405 [Alphaproteobacteria bacterium]|nr:hypothetical protein [Alphaproteobacteria bacterium]